jgi:ribosomal protein S18 acetylase RimI-like enzyme
VRHRWESAAIGPTPPASEGFSFRDAVADEATRVAEIAIDAYASDPTWQEMMPGIRMRMTRRVTETLGQAGSSFVVAVTPSGELAGCSGVVVEHPSGQNFLTGICVLPEYQRRGVGRRLLWESLSRLYQLGVARPLVYTELGSIADRFIYPLFSSSREEGVVYPAASLGEASQ